MVRPLMIRGKPAVVAVAELRIKQAKDVLKDKGLSRSEREKKSKEAFKNISDMATGLRMKQQIPDSIYKSMKLSDDYIREERDGNAAALKELDAAIDELKSYQ